MNHNNENIISIIKLKFPFQIDEDSLKNWELYADEFTSKYLAFQYLKNKNCYRICIFKTNGFKNRKEAWYHSINFDIYTLDKLTTIIKTIN